ncbi:hypothetical protein GCM10027321_20520 [Massilia terrae]|uniref:Filamentous hemagglutinin N-terminal domain-containing protein n=1 Tax=Massilia terrae TaxID=1811224 RepID=A0ABT2CVU9_9BURK|nr:filamentous hemagglutinin N-terminal domain-containing protein [Massilia terrae]MCS0657940.1 filamentous hemagglutinin N-terminal domain-containing protein [Massilia terrae]
MTTTIFKRRLLPLLLAASVGAAVAAPTGQQVVAGQATFNQQGNVFSITNTPGTIINWQSFSIGAGEVTRFIQQSADSAVLNRIVGQDPSRILGALQSNGKVFLINPNGIVFGRDARVDVNGLVASSLNLSNADFLAGKKNFQAGAVAGEVRNEGAITTPNGGQVYLIAPKVGNSGIIRSPQGEVVLAAGHSVQLVDARDPDLNVVVSAPADQSINLGSVVAQGGRIGIYGALVSQRGIINADSAVVGENGKILFKASRAAQLEAGSVTSATGAGKGGTVHVLGESVALNGDAAVDASGAQGGGAVLVGGDWQGANAALANARTTTMSGAASIKADALVSGEGGKVVLWSNDSTAAYGSISAHGAGGGKGGKVETSGHSLAIDGIRVDAGKGGSWLLDPYDIEVSASGTAKVGDVSSPNAGLGTGVTKIAPATLTAGGADILLQAQHDITVTDALNASGNVTASAGHDINVNADVSSSGGSLTLLANNSLNLASGASLKSNRYVDLIADSMSLNGNIGSAGGALPVITFNPASDSRPIAVGGNPNTGVLWLDSGALSRFSAFEINLGSSANTGGISVNGGVSQAASVVLDSAGSIAFNAPVTSSSGSVVATLHGAPGTLLDVNAAINAGQLLQLKGDGLRISAPVAATSVVLAPHSATTPIVLGKLGEGTFALDETMLKRVNASTLTIGGQPGQVGGTQIEGPIDLTSHPFGKLVIDAGAPGVSIDSLFTMPSGVLNLKSGGDIVQSIVGGLNVGQLAFNAGGALHFNGANTIGNVTGSAGYIDINAAGPLAIGSSGLSASQGGLRVITTGPLALGGNVGAASDQVTLVAKGISGSGTVSANMVQLQSTDGIGSASAPVNTVASSLMLFNQQSGAKPVNVSNTGDATLYAAQQTDGTSGANTGALTVHTTGDLTVAAAPVLATSAPNVSAYALNGVRTGAGAIDLAAGGRMTVNGSVSSTSGNIGLAAAGDMTVSGSVTSGSGNLALSSGGKLSVLSGASVTSSSGDINVTAGSTAIANGTVTGAPGKVHLPNTTPTPPPPAPTLDQCIASPSTTGCGSVLDAAKTACSADWNAGHCDQVMPSLAVCTATPTALGCSAVIAHNALLACVANPQGPNCGAVLPTVDSCKANGTQLGCDTVLAQRAKVDACLANPSAAGCGTILPTYDQCQAQSGVYGCGPAIAQHDRVAACVANPSATCFDTILPKYEVCQANPSTFGCAPVTQRHDAIAACIANPSGATCGSVLPALAVCHADASVFGCAPVLAREQFLACVANPSSPSCDSILPALAVCKATPSLEGCSAVIGKTFNFCLGSPNDARCVGILPTLSQCVADKSVSGCQVVLPTLAQCTASPTLQGCAVVLPKLEQCAANPNLEGCSAVLPKPDFCSTHPSDPTCQVFNPAPSGGADSKTTPVTQATQTTVTLVNSSVSQVTSSSSSGGGGGTSSSDNAAADKKSDKQTGPATSENNGAKNEKPATKMYCN